VEAGSGTPGSQPVPCRPDLGLRDGARERPGPGRALVDRPGRACRRTIRKGWGRAPAGRPAAGGRPAEPGACAAAGVSTLLGWFKWGALVGGVFGLIGCGAMMAIGRRNRHSLAADGATGIPWVLAGLTLIALSSGIAGVFM
jgi:hypothetical protein